MTEAADLDPREEHKEDRVDPIGELEEVQIRKKSHHTTSPQLGGVIQDTRGLWERSLQARNSPRRDTAKDLKRDEP
jgi:hypothetical protein